MLDDLRARDVKFRSLTEAIYTDTPTGRTMWQTIGVMTESERSVKFGRKVKLTPEQILNSCPSKAS